MNEIAIELLAKAELRIRDLERERDMLQAKSQQAGSFSVTIIREEEGLYLACWGSITGIGPTPARAFLDLGQREGFIRFVNEPGHLFPKQEKT